MRSLFCVGLVALVALGQAQDRVRFTIGYGQSGDYVNRFNRTVNVVGPEVGLEIPLTRLGRFELTLAPSVFLGGRLSSSSDSDGDIYRYLVVGRTALDRSGTYLLAGFGYSHSVDRANQFEATNGTVARLGLGIPVSVPALAKFRPTLEFSHIAGPNGQLRGTFVSLNGKL